jgi:hypothetical protein
MIAILAGFATALVSWCEQQPSIRIWAVGFATLFLVLFAFYVAAVVATRKTLSRHQSIRRMPWRSVVLVKRVDKTLEALGKDWKQQQIEGITSEARAEEVARMLGNYKKRLWDLIKEIPGWADSPQDEIRIALNKFAALATEFEAARTMGVNGLRSDIWEQAEASGRETGNQVFDQLQAAIHKALSGSASQPHPQ